MRRPLLGLYTYCEFFLLVVVFLVPMGIVTLIHRDKDPGNRIRGRWMRRFGRVTSGLTPLWKFSVEGSAPPEVRGGAVVVSNHESTSDPFLLSWLPWDMRWVAKEEIFKLPLIGWLMKFGGDIPLRRGRRESILEMLEECRRTIAAGTPVMIFPEGTRSPDGRLLPFKDGAFQLAIEMQVPIVPVAIAGTRECRPKGSLWFGEARAVVRVLEPIATTGMTLEDLPRLRELTRGRIAEGAEDLRRKLGLVRAPAQAPEEKAEPLLSPVLRPPAPADAP